MSGRTEPGIQSSHPRGPANHNCVGTRALSQLQRLPPWPDLAPLGPILNAARIVGLFEWNIAEDRIFPCLGMARIFGLDVSTVRRGAPSSAFVAALHPGDRTTFTERPSPTQGRIRQTIYRVAPAGHGSPRTILDVTQLSFDAHGKPDWACGALFDHPGAGSSTTPLNADRILDTLDRAAGLAIELRGVVRDIKSPTLHLLVDMVLIEIASSLGRQIDRPELSRLN